MYDFIAFTQSEIRMHCSQNSATYTDASLHGLKIRIHGERVANSERSSNYVRVLLTYQLAISSIHSIFIKPGGSHLLRFIQSGVAFTQRFWKGSS